MEKILVPDIGGASLVDVIEVLVKVGDVISKDTPLVTLESDKATMEIPSEAAGVVSSIEVKLGDKVSEGDIILTYSASDTKETDSVKVVADEAKVIDVAEKAEKPQEIVLPVSQAIETPTTTIIIDEVSDSEIISAGPSARRLAHKLGVSLVDIAGSGRKSRISKEDVEQYVKQKLANNNSNHKQNVPLAKVIDFSKFGEIETKSLNKIKKLTGASVHYSWTTIPHVTHFDNADITDLEEFRKSEQKSYQDKGVKLTILAFVCKVVSRALEIYPQFNSSLDASLENVIYKKYCNIGIAVETPNGLVVPVIKNIRNRSVADIASEMARLSSIARDKGLSPADMSGGTFTISSLGGIGGTSFTPIVNSPEVAILGLSKAEIKPVYKDGIFVPRLILPISLSYDHRVIDGAEAARFARNICDGLSDLRRILL